jgi:hypothetical protein
MPRQQKSEQKGVKQICQHCKGHSQKKIVGGKAKHTYIARGKGLFIHKLTRKRKAYSNKKR